MSHDTDEPQYTVDLNGKRYELNEEARRSIQKRARLEYEENERFSCWWKTASHEQYEDDEWEENVHDAGDPVLVIETQGYMVPWEKLDKLNVEMQDAGPFSDMDSGGQDADSVDSGGGFHQFADTDHLSAYPQPGDVITFYEYGDGFIEFVINISDRPTASPRSCYRYFSGKIQEFDEENNDSGVTGGVGRNANQWNEIEIEWGLDYQFTVRSYNASTGDLIGEVSGSPNQKFGVGGVQFRSDSGFSAVGQVEISRREPQARANTAKGVTELGNEVVPSGSIQTGPMEVPTDHPNYPTANLPVTDDLSAGEQVGYHLAINQDKALTLEAEADGNGGIQNAQVSFENTQIADPAHNTSADSMTADPESASEDGFVEVDINGTTYQVPMYQA